MALTLPRRDRIDLGSLGILGNLTTPSYQRFQPTDYRSQPVQSFQQPLQVSNTPPVFQQPVQQPTYRPPQMVQQPVYNQPQGNARVGVFNPASQPSQIVEAPVVNPMTSMNENLFGKTNPFTYSPEKPKVSFRTSQNPNATNDFTQAPTIETRAKKIEEGILQNKSLDQLSQETGLTKGEIAQYTDKYAKGYGAKHPIEAIGNFLGDMAKSTADIVIKPVATINALANPEVKKGIESQINTVNQAYKNKQISKAKLEEEVKRISGDIIGANYKVTDNGVEQMNKGEAAGKFVGDFVEGGVNASNIIPAGLAFNQGKKILLEQGFKAVAKQIAIMNAKQALILGTATTGSDILNKRGVTLESIAMNYGAPFILGTVGELAGIGVNKLKFTKTITNAIDNAEQIKGSKLSTPEVKTLTAEVKNELIKQVTPQVSKTVAQKAKPVVKLKETPQVSVKTNLTKNERAAGAALGFSEKETKNIKLKYQGKLEADNLIQERGLNSEDLGQLTPKEQSALANIDPKFTVKEPDITVTNVKSPEVKSLMKDISRSVSGSQVRGQTVTSMVSSKANQLGVKIDQDFIGRYQKGILEGDAEKEMGKFLRETITDPTFKLQQAIDPSIQHRKNYVPQSYAQDEGTIAEAIRKLNTKTKSSVPRSFNTYEEAAQFGLTPRHQTLDKILGENVAEAAKVYGNRQVIDNGLKNGIFSTSSRKGIPVEGFFDINRKQIYASKEVADMINRTLQTDSTMLGRGLRSTAEVASTAQDVMLQGGVPGTNFNFFVAGQAIKDTTRNIGKFILHPGQAIKQEGHLLADLFRGTKGTQARFAENAKFIKELSDNGLDISHQSNLFNEGKSGVRKAWNTLGNNPTFGRYQPNRMLSTAKEVYQQSVDKLGHTEAVKLAANKTKVFNGLVDYIAKGESKMTQDAKSILFFAPKYRESIINALWNTVKSLDPRTFKNSSYTASRELLTGMGITLAAYELMNRQTTGHSMFENRQGQELSLEIPYGEKDEKGNQPVINIPFMPGFMTIPRAIVGGVTSAIKGDVKGVIKEASKMSSAPIQIAGNVLANRDYFDRPIYNDEQVAANEGVNPDNPAEAVIKIGAYIGGQLSPAWIRGGIGVAQGKPLEQNIAVALEAPIRFGKHLNPATESYFKDRDEIYNSLDKNSKAVWDSIYPRLKNSNGDYMVDKTVDSGLARASNFLNNPDVLAGANEMAKRAKTRGEATDPFYNLTGEQQRIALRIDTLPPKDPNKTVLRAQNEWYQPYLDKRSTFFDSLPEGDPNKPKGPITYPEPTAEVAALQDAYYQLTDSTMKRQMMTDNPEIAEQFAKEEQYSRAVRAAKNLPQYDKYPEPTKEVQNLIDFYMQLPKNDGPNGKSSTRSAWIKSHPDEWAKMGDQFDKQSLYNLQQDMSLAAFEGQDPTDKGIKALASLGGSSGGSSGYGSYGSNWIDFKKTDPTLNPMKYAVSLKAGGTPSKALKSSVSIGTIKKSKVSSKTSKPKVSIKKALT